MQSATSTFPLARLDLAYLSNRKKPIDKLSMDTNDNLATEQQGGALISSEWIQLTLEMLEFELVDVWGRLDAKTLRQTDLIYNRLQQVAVNAVEVIQTS